MTEEKFLEILRQHVPHGSVEYCYSLWRKNPFHLKITRTRHSKGGDFFCPAPNATPRITINKELNPYLFLVTFIHEVAHLHIHKRHSRATYPHGIEWKQCFQQLMQPVLHENIFPASLLQALFQHMKNPKASSYSDAGLTKAFRLFDPNPNEMITVAELADGSHFKLRDKYFKKGQLRRTRFLCAELNSKRKYLVPAEALVSEVQLQLF